MKNFKQTIPAIIFGLLVVGAVSFADIKTQTNTNCTPPTCNPDVIYSVDDQVKTGGVTANYIGSTSNIDVRDSFIIGANVKNLPFAYEKGGLRVINGLTFFKDKLYISDSNPLNNPDNSITDNPYTPPTTPQYDLTLRPGSTTNLGTGDYCTKKANQISLNTSGCTSGAFVTGYNGSSTGSSMALRCTDINPSTTPDNKGGCPTFNATLTRSYDGTSGSSSVGPFACQYTVAISNATNPVSIVISRYIGWGGYSGYSTGILNSYATRTTSSGSETFGSTTPGAGAFICNNAGDIKYRAQITDANGQFYQTAWVK
ncbi:MAG: hypothetical protein ACR2IQ_00265 [Minisyncoccia bacterium]